ncbi:MAG: energy transducer TonB [Bacteroidota bacterium]
MEKIITLALLLTTTLLFAQSENDKKIFLDSLWKETTEGNHKFFRIIKDYSTEQEKYKFYEYYSSGELYREGYTKGNYYILIDGEIQEHYKSGKLKRTFNAQNGKNLGSITEWYENGALKFEGDYINDNNDELVNKLKIINFWDAINRQTVKNGFGNIIIDNDEVSEKGEVKNYEKNGTWEGFDKNVNLKFSELFSEGKLINGNSADADNNKYTYSVVSTNPQPKEGYKDFYLFVGNKMRIPNVKNAISGRVLLSFIVNKAGEITDIEVLKSLQPDIDYEAIAVLKKYGNWIPGTIRGKNVKVRFALPFKIDIK